MAIPDVSVSLLPILVAALINIVLGSLWYSPSLFGNQWMKLSGIKKGKITAAKKKGMAVSYVLALVAAFVMAYILAHFVLYVSASNFASGMELGFWLWLGFAAPIQLGMVLWEGKPVKLYLINTTYYLALLMINAGLLAAWI